MVDFSVFRHRIGHRTADAFFREPIDRLHIQQRTFVAAAIEYIEAKRQICR
jgi:hypothetical protein